MEKSGAESIFESLNKYEDIENLIIEGESENLYLECKTSRSSKLNPDTKNHLAKAISGFSNANGGVIIYVINTEKKSKRDGEADSLDVLTEIEPIGYVDSLMKSIRNSIPSLTIPSVLDFKIKTIKPNGKAMGIVILLIKKNNGDPILSAMNEQFYFRSGDKFINAPYEVIKRLFAATESPDIHVSFSEKIFSCDEEKYWLVPIRLVNESSAIGENVHVNVEILNHDSCEKVVAENFNDVSNVNPGSRVYMVDVKGVVHRGLPIVIEKLKIKMKKGAIKVSIRIDIFANKMRAKSDKFNLYLNRKKFKIKKISSDHIY